MYPYYQGSSFDETILPGKSLVLISQNSAVEITVHIRMAYDATTLFTGRSSCFFSTFFEIFEILDISHLLILHSKVWVSHSFFFNHQYAQKSFLPSQIR
jgi:hypothetical protein